eukprot:3919717-Alexandrium_andersonii.AAC.1
MAATKLAGGRTPRKTHRDQPRECFEGRGVEPARRPASDWPFATLGAKPIPVAWTAAEVPRRVPRLPRAAR